MATSSKSGEKPVKSKATAAARKPASPAKTTAKPKAAKTAAPAESKATRSAVSTVKTTAKTTGARKSAGTRKSLTPLSPDQRRYYVEVAAYYIAERRGFQGGNALEDWAAAEAEVDRLLREGILNA